MKKSILKNLIALTFALGALVFVAGNVMAYGENPEEECPDYEVEVGGKKHICNPCGSEECVRQDIPGGVFIHYKN